VKPTWTALAVLLALTSASCSGDEADAKTRPAAAETPGAETPGAETQDEAGVLDQVSDAAEKGTEELAERKAALETKIADLETTLTERRKELEALLAELKGLSATELLGSEGKSLEERFQARGRPERGQGRAGRAGRLARNRARGRRPAASGRGVRAPRDARARPPSPLRAFRASAASR
jgi:chromosome segregation ATPase